MKERPSGRGRVSEVLAVAAAISRSAPWPTSGQCFPPHTQGRVQLAPPFGRIQPLIDPGGLATHTGQPLDEASQGIDQQQDIQPMVLAGQAALEAMTVAMRLQIAEGGFDLHPAPIQRDQLSCAHVHQTGRGHDQPRFAFPRCTLPAELAVCHGSVPGDVLAALGALAIDRQAADQRPTAIEQRGRR